MSNYQRNIRIYLSWLCGSHGISLLPWKKETLAISKTKGNLTFYVFNDWLYSRDPAVFEILEGGFYHEALGHGKHTDFDAMEIVEKQGMIKWTPLARNINNIFEDIFIEREAAKMYPTVQRAINKTVEILESKGFFGKKEDFAACKPVQLLTASLLNFCRGRLLPGQDAYLSGNIAELSSLLPGAFGSMWDDIWEIAKESANSQSTYDSINLTVRVMNLIQDIADADEQDDQKSDDSKEYDDEGDSDQNGQGQPSSIGSPSKETIEAAKSILADMDEEGLSTELTDVINAAVKESQDKEGNGCGGGDIRVVPVAYTDQSNDSVRVAAVMKSAAADLEELLMAETYTQRENVERGNRIDKASLVRGASGFTKSIFERETLGEGLSTAIYGLFDFSGSMTSSSLIKGAASGIDAANGIMLGLGDILDEFDVPYEFSAYSDEFMTFKSFDCDGYALRRTQKAPDLSGGTVTGGAVQIALSRLACRPEKRKLLIIATDGDTCDLDLLISCYNEAKIMGIEIASIMLGKVIPSIQALANESGFKATAIGQVSGLGRFVVDRIKESIR